MKKEIQEYLKEHQLPQSGYVIVWCGEIVGWTADVLREPNAWRPGVTAKTVSEDPRAHDYIAEGGSYERGAKMWAVLPLASC